MGAPRLQVVLFGPIARRASACPGIRSGAMGCITEDSAFLHEGTGLAALTAGPWSRRLEQHRSSCLWQDTAEAGAGSPGIMGEARHQLCAVASSRCPSLPTAPDSSLPPPPRARGAELLPFKGTA